MRKDLLYCAIPLALLVADLLVFPLVQNRVVIDQINVNDLVRGKIVSIGRYQLHPIYVSMGQINDPIYLRRLGGPDGIAVSAYSESTENPLSIATLTEALLTALPPDEARALTNFISETKSLQPGRVQQYRRTASHSETSLRGIRTIFIARLVPGNGGDAKAALAQGITALMAALPESGTSRLLLPALSVSSTKATAATSEAAPSFDDFYGDFFDAVDKNPGPAAIDLTLWSALSNGDLESAVGSFNGHLAMHRVTASGSISNIYRLQIRLILIGLCIGLLSSARRLKLTLRSTLMISLSLALYLLGVFKFIETVLAGFSTETQDWIIAAAAAGLSGAYPAIIQWSTKDLFKEESRAP